jgi:hypothetical protein
MKITCRIENGNKVWRNEKGQLHRKNGPAIEYTNGSKAWWQNDKLHRLDGPAVECYDGTKYWYQNGKCHRINGPAKEYSDGFKEWWIEGREYTEDEFTKLSNKLNIDIRITINGKQYKLVPSD